MWSSSLSWLFSNAGSLPKTLFLSKMQPQNLHVSLELQNPQNPCSSTFICPWASHRSWYWLDCLQWAFPSPCLFFLKPKSLKIACYKYVSFPFSFGRTLCVLWQEPGGLAHKISGNSLAWAGFFSPLTWGSSTPLWPLHGLLSWDLVSSSGLHSFSGSFLQPKV